MVVFWCLLLLCGIFSAEGAGYGSSGRGGYGASFNLQSGSNGYGANAQLNIGSTNCQWVWVNLQWSWSCGQNGEQNDQPPPNEPPPPGQSPPEESVAEQPPPEESETPQKYIYDFQVQSAGVRSAENPYTDLINSMGYRTCFPGRECNFTWKEEINNDTNLVISWNFFDNWKTSEEQPVNLCEASYSSPDTLAYNTFKFLAAVTANGVTSCPIPAGKAKVQANFPWHMELKDKIPCGQMITYNFRATLPDVNGDGQSVDVVNISFKYDLPVDDDNCVPRKEAQAAKRTEN